MEFSTLCWEPRCFLQHLQWIVFELKPTSASPSTCRLADRPSLKLFSSNERRADIEAFSIVKILITISMWNQYEMNREEWWLGSVELPLLPYWEISSVSTSEDGGDLGPGHCSSRWCPCGHCIYASSFVCNWIASSLFPWSLVLYQQSLESN